MFVNTIKWQAIQTSTIFNPWHVSQMAESTQPDNSVQSPILSGHMYDSFLSLKDYTEQRPSFPCKHNAPSSALCLQAFLYPHTD